MTVLKSIALFVLAAIAEIGGAWLVWQGVREHKGWVWIGAGVIALGLYGFVATLQPDAHFGRILAAYGGVFVAGSLIWGMIADGFRPDRWDVTGALICLIGVAVIMYAPRSRPDDCATPVHPALLTGCRCPSYDGPGRRSAPRNRTPTRCCAEETDKIMRIAGYHPICRPPGQRHFADDRFGENLHRRRRRRRRWSEVELTPTCSCRSNAPARTPASHAALVATRPRTVP